MIQICFVSKCNSKTENSCLPNASHVSSVNEPISVGICSVSSFSSIGREKHRNEVRYIE